MNFISLETELQKLQIKKRKRKLINLKARPSIKNILKTKRELNSNTVPSAENFYEIVKFFVKRNIKRYHPSNRLPVEDICWDCFTHLYVCDNHVSFLGRYDKTKSKLHNYVTHGVKNYLIDLERKTGKMKFVYESEELMNMLSNVGDLNNNEPIDVIHYLLEEIRPEVIRPLMSRKFKKSIKLEDNSAINLSEFILLHLILAGYNQKEISDFFKVTPSYIGKLYKRSVSLLREKVLGDSINIPYKLQGFFFDNYELLQIQQSYETELNKDF